MNNNLLYAVPFKTAADTIFYLYRKDPEGRTIPVSWIHGDNIDKVSEYAFINGFSGVIIEEREYPSYAE